MFNDHCLVLLNLYSATHSSGRSAALAVREPREEKMGFPEEGEECRKRSRLLDDCHSKTGKIPSMGFSSTYYLCLQIKMGVIQEMCNCDYYW